MRSAAGLVLVAMLTLTLAACGAAPTRRYPTAAAPPPVATKPPVRTKAGPAPSHEKDRGPNAADIPENLALVPDAIPRFEPLSRYGNPPSYEVFGETYTVLPTAEGYRETGLASWYGEKFHGRRTSSGEAYDMYEMTAAHKTLPLPSYARVTNLKNGRSIIVRINDRGPFHSGRIMDLSYAAATKLGTSGGLGMVEVETIMPGKTPPPPPLRLPVKPAIERDRGFLQVAAYSDPINAVALREELLSGGAAPIEIRAVVLGDVELYRVLIGPFEDPLQLSQIREKLVVEGYDPDVVAN